MRCLTGRPAALLALAAALVGSALFGGARAEAPKLHLLYEGYWGGLHAADFRITLDNPATLAKGPVGNDFRLQTRGLLDIFIKLDVDAKSRGQLVSDNPGLKVDSYHVRYRNKKRQRTIDIAFPGNDQPARVKIHTRKFEENTESTDTKPADKVTEDMLVGVTDPLSAFIEALHRVRHHLKGGTKEFTLRVYDGRRRFDVEGVYKGKTERTILRVRHPVHHLVLSTIPVAGFRESRRVLWDGSAFDVYLTTDGRFIPLQIKSLGFGPVLNLTGECPQVCELKRKN
ncbi:MAG: DUF3108 domain-containing protein [Rhodospirillales bacterium]|nr:DUF3108 domain-containing protein [Rhodospirillales bacterium]